MTETNYILSSPLGNLLIRANDNAVLAVLFVKQGNEIPVIEKNAGDHRLIKICCTQLSEYFEGTRKEFDLPLQQNGTPFQQKVWDELINIPYGKTISYLELSKRIGDTKAIRAVGTTNGKNNISILVPCHRVIGSNGSLTGYAGELWRKQWLLEHEAKLGNGLQLLF
jgi:methylated-DNA-[protein]-cysteine S-methyltransferase